MILRKIFGFRLELGARYTLIENTTLLEGVSFAGFNIIEREEHDSFTHAIGVFLSPKIDFFVGQRINIVANLGSIGYFRTSFDSLVDDVIWQFQSNISPNNIGLGVEFNF